MVGTLQYSYINIRYLYINDMFYSISNPSVLRLIYIM